MFRNPYPRTSWTAALACIVLLAISPARSAPAPDTGCDAHAGSITTDSTQQCLVNGSVTLLAQPGGDAVVPPGYQIGYVLTSTNGLSIEQVGPNPSFTVSGVNIWRIHSLVYDPNTLDFAAILDLDHAYQLQDMLVQGGICASFDISGAGTKTTECPTDCTADAGSISALNPDQCLVDGTAQLEALPDDNAMVPTGFSVAHVLTTGPDLLILAVGAEPSFSVQAEGSFTIHTLVYDPTTLDLSGIVFGETSAFEIAALLQQGGGPICGSLDVAGAQFQVAACNPVCEAFAGTLTAVAGEVCLVDGSADLDATPNGDAVVPAGYSIAYILARPNGIIENVEPITLFQWPLTGEYVIHTVVYDPANYNPFGVQLGTTNVSEIDALLLQGGGSICGSLDLTGAPISVIDCAPPCSEYAGVGGDRILCFTDPVTDLFSLLTDSPDEGGSWSGPDGQAFSGSFNPATDAQGVYVYFVSDGPDCQGDTTNLVISLIECPGPCDADAGPDATYSVCNAGAQTDVGLDSFLNGDTGGFWIGPDGQPSDGSFALDMDPPGAYAYVVGASDECDGDTAYVTVIVVNVPDAGSSADVSVCDSDAPFFCLLLLGGSPDAGGTWTGPDGAPFDGTFDPATDLPGVYQYTVPGQAPCLNAAATLAITVTACCDAGADTAITVCFTDEPFLLLDALGGDPCPSGTWTDPQNLPHSNVFNPAIDVAGVYTYTVAGAPGEPSLVATLTINVFECPDPCSGSSPDAGIGGDLIRCTVDPVTELFDLLQGTPDVGGTWTGPDGNAFSGVFDPASSASGVYVYTVFDLLDCEPDTTQLNISVIECPQAYAQLVAWPNPSVDKVNIRFPTVLSAGATIDILDALGRSVRASLTLAGDLITVDVSAMPSGTYTLRAFDAGTSHTGRFARAKD